MQNTTYVHSYTAILHIITVAIATVGSYVKLFVHHIIIIYGVCQRHYVTFTAHCIVSTAHLNPACLSSVGMWYR